MSMMSFRAGPAKPQQQNEVVIEGRAVLSSGREFSFTATNVTASSADLCADIIVKPGETLVCHLTDIALLPGTIVSVSQFSFHVVFHLSDDRTSKVAAQLEWHVGRATRTADLRRAPRIVPLHKAVEVWLDDQMVCSGTILNVSMSGAAIGLADDDIPFLGSRVRVGSRFATVVRLMEGGIGVEFLEPFAPENFDERIKL